MTEGLSHRNNRARKCEQGSYTSGASIRCLEVASGFTEGRWYFLTLECCEDLWSLLWRSGSTCMVSQRRCKMGGMSHACVLGMYHLIPSCSILMKFVPALHPSFCRRSTGRCSRCWFGRGAASVGLRCVDGCCSVASTRDDAVGPPSCSLGGNWREQYWDTYIYIYTYILYWIYIHSSSTYKYI